MGNHVKVRVKLSCHPFNGDKGLHHQKEIRWNAKLVGGAQLKELVQHPGGFNILQGF